MFGEKWSGGFLILEERHITVTAGVGAAVAAGGAGSTTGVGKKSSSLAFGNIAVLYLIWSTYFFTSRPSNKETVYDNGPHISLISPDSQVGPLVKFLTNTGSPI